MKINRKSISIRSRYALCILIAFILIVCISLTACGQPEDGGAGSTETPVVTETSEVKTVGDPAEVDKLTGKWVSYNEGLRFTAEYDGQGKLSYISALGAESEYACSAEGDKIVQTKGGKRQVYLWTDYAVTFMSDHSYNDINLLSREAGQTIQDFYGYIYPDGDLLYIGKLIMCRESVADGEDQPLEGIWVGAAGDRVAFDSDGGYHYRQYGEDFDGEYVYDESSGDLELSMSGTTNTYSSDSWGIEGATLHINNQYYFKKLN